MTVVEKSPSAPDFRPFSTGCSNVAVVRSAVVMASPPAARYRAGRAPAGLIRSQSAGMKSGCGRDGSEVETHQTASTNVLHTVPTVASRAAHSGGVSWNLADSGELQRRRRGGGRDRGRPAGVRSMADLRG